jgi:hypothetical protein
METKKLAITKIKLKDMIMDGFSKGKNDYPDKKFKMELNRDLKFLFGEF